MYFVRQIPMSIHVYLKKILNYFILDKKKIFKVISVFLKNLCMFDDFIQNV